MFFLRLTTSTFALLLAFSSVAEAQLTLLVLSKADHTLSAVNPETRKVLWKAPVGDDPHEVIANLDSTLAFVSNYGSGAFHTLAVIDLEGKHALPSIDLGALHGPHGLTFVGSELWFTAEGSKALGSLNPETGRINTVIGTGQDRTHMLWVSDDRKTVVATNVASGTLSILREYPASGGPLHSDWEQYLLDVGKSSEGFDITPSHKQVWVATASDGSVTIVDIPNSKVLDKISVGAQGANRLKITPNGKYALVTSLTQPDLFVIDIQTHKLVKRVPIGHAAAGLIIDPSGSKAFASCGPDNYVAVIDLHSWKVLGHIQAGDNPDGLAWATIH